MKRKKIAMLLAVAMVASGVTAPMEAVYASDDVQIQMEETEGQEEDDEVVCEDAEDAFDAEDISIEEEQPEIDTEEASEEPAAEKIAADEFSDGEAADAGESQEVIEKGFCGADWQGSSDYRNTSYKLYADGRLVFEGAGMVDTSDFQNDSRIKSVQISEGITDLGDAYSYTFWGCKNLKSVTLPQSLTCIGNYSFYECESLESIVLPQNLTNLGYYAFTGCKSIKTLVIPDKLNSANIGDGAFAGCSDLRSVTLPENFTFIPKQMFSNCSRLTDITLPESVTEIKDGAFSFCYDLKEIALPKGLTTIGASAFSYSGLLNVVLPEGLKTIGDSAFASTNFSEIVLPEGLTYIGEAAFSGNSKLEGITVPKNITELNKTFSSCGALKTVSLPSGLQKIEGAFSSCGKLESITIPDNVSVIGDNTFRYCWKLKEIHLPTNLTNIGYEAFSGCEVLANISLPEKLESIDSGAFKNCPNLLGIYIPGMNVQIKSRAIGYNSDTEKNEKLVVIGKAGSTAEKYAKDTGLKFHNIADSLTHQSVADAACIKGGYKEYWHCNTCGQNFSNADGTAAFDVEALSKFVHNKVYVPYKDATCTEAGNIGYYHCEACGKNFEYSWEEDNTEVKNVTIPAKGHDWQWNTISATGSVPSVTHGYTRAIHASGSEVMERRCWKCNQVAETKTIKKVLNVNVDQITLKCGQSSTAFRTSGDPIKSVVPESNLVRVTNVKNNSFKVTADSRRTGSTVIRITTTTDMSVIVVVFVQKGAIKTKGISGLPKSVNIAKGKSVTLKPIREPFTSPEKLTYSSSNKGVATVSSKGVIKAKKAGTAKITVKSGKKKVVVTVRVTGVKTTKLSGVPKTKKLSKGKTFKIKAVATPRNTSEKITFRSSNKKVATVTSKGVVKGLRKGTATITVQSGSKKMTCKVTVK